LNDEYNRKTVAYKAKINITNKNEEKTIKNNKAKN